MRAVGDAFVLIEPERMALISLPVEMIGATISAVPGGLGDAATIPTVRQAGGEALRPPSPCGLWATRGTAGLMLGWTRRSRGGWAWVDGDDAPLGESSEAYRVRLAQGAVEASWTCAVPLLSIPDAELASFASGVATLSVSQLGDRAASRETAININL